MSSTTTAQLKAHEPSLYIARVFPNISWKRVKEVFENELNLGVVDRIDMPKCTSKDGKEYKKVFIHFKKWNNTPEVDTVRSEIINGDTLKVIYDEPWFWKFSKSKIDKPKFNKPTKPKATKTKAKLVKDTELTTKAEADKLRSELAELKAQMASLVALTSAKTDDADEVDYTPSTPVLEDSDSE